MILPLLAGSTPTASQFIFAAGDAEYFDKYGYALVNSILQHTDYNVHIHLYNPSSEQVLWLNSKDKVSSTHEYFCKDEFEYITTMWLNKSEFSNVRQKQMYDKGKLFGKDFLQDLIIKTYYACARFVRLEQIIPENSRCLSIDIDGIVRKNFDMLFENESSDIYLYRKKSFEHLAGAILFTERSSMFLKEYANNVKTMIHDDNIYWFMDQVELDKVVPKYNVGLLPMSYIDWEMSPSSAIWSAKGKRKDLSIFLDEIKKYNP